MTPKSVVKKLYHFIQALFDEELTYYASSLSFYTIFTITPLVLIILSLLPSLPNFSEHFETLRTFIFSNLMPVYSETLSTYLDTFLHNSDKLGTLGAIMLFIASFLFFENYEYITAKIFNTKQRTFFSSLSTYWALLTLTPLALLAFFYLSAKIEIFLHVSMILPFIVMWLLFYLIFKVSPNKNITFKATFVSSFFTTFVWSIAKSAFVYYAFYNKSYETIYGSFSILIFFFLWIYLSWIIFLYGLKMCFLLNEKEQNNHHN